jgi:predicted nucleotidyltransferase
LALESSQLVLEKTRARGLAIDVIGSLARGEFGLHSDVDFFVHGETDPARRVQVERLVATAFNGTGIPYDIVYETDLTQERVREFLNG